MGCFQSKLTDEREDHRKFNRNDRLRKPFNKSIHRKRKFFAGVEIVKDSDRIGAEGNFHFCYNVDKKETYSDPFESEKILEVLENKEDGE